MLLPCAQASGWLIAAILPYLAVMNGASISMEYHVLANRKHGSEADQRRLALRIFDDAFTASAVRGGREKGKEEGTRRKEEGGETQRERRPYCW
jgi:hypothetical protein